MSDPFTPRRRPNWGAATSQILFPRPWGYPEDFSPYWPHGLDFSGQADSSAVEPMQRADSAAGARSRPASGQSLWAPLENQNPDLSMNARATAPSATRGGPPAGVGQTGRSSFSDDVPAFQRDLQSDSGAALHDSHLTRVGLKHVVEGAEGLYDIVSKVQAAKDVKDAAVAVAENKIDDDDVSSNGRMLQGGKSWLVDVQKDHRPGSEFASIVVTDDGFLLTSHRGFAQEDTITRQPPPVRVRTEFRDDWNDLEALTFARDDLIRRRSAWGKGGEVAANIVTGLTFPGLSGLLNDGAQWAFGRPSKYPGFSAEQSLLIRQAALEARIAQLRRRQGR